MFVDNNKLQNFTDCRQQNNYLHENMKNVLPTKLSY